MFKYIKKEKFGKVMSGVDQSMLKCSRNQINKFDGEDAKDRGNNQNLIFILVSNFCLWIWIIPGFSLFTAYVLLMCWKTYCR